MKKLVMFVCVVILAFGMTQIASATIITEPMFLSPIIIDFEDAPSGPIGGFYSTLGVEFVNLWGGDIWNTGHGYSYTAVNWDANFNFYDGEAIFSTIVTRVGMDITTNDPDDTKLSAYLGSTLVGEHTFDTYGAGTTGSFIGVEFMGGFDRLVIDATENANGAFAIDNFRYTPHTPIPEPSSIALLGVGMFGVMIHGWRKKKRGTK